MVRRIRVGGFGLPTLISHYWHKNIISHCDRPFLKREEPDVRQMNRTLIENHNNTVGLDDEVIFVGDIAPWAPFKQVQDVVLQLNGVKRLVRGNHDEFTAKDYLLIGFTEVTDVLAVYFEGVGPVGVAHDPSYCLTDMSMPWINGHLHNLYKVFGNSVNVGVDVWDYKPVSDEELAPILMNIKKFGWEAMKNDPTGNLKKKGLIF